MEFLPGGPKGIFTPGKIRGGGSNPTSPVFESGTQTDQPPPFYCLTKHEWGCARQAQTSNTVAQTQKPLGQQSRQCSRCWIIFNNTLIRRYSTNPVQERLTVPLPDPITGVFSPLSRVKDGPWSICWLRIRQGMLQMVLINEITR